MTGPGGRHPVKRMARHGGIRLRQPVHRGIVAVDIEGFGRLERDNTDRGYLRATLRRLLERALRQAGVQSSHELRTYPGDGVLVLIHPEVSKVVLVGRLITRLSAALAQHNRTAAPATRLRLRAVVHAGEIVYDDDGPFGEDLNLAFRLLNANELRRRLTGADAPLALIVSDTIYQGVVKHRYHEIEPGAYRPSAIRTKEGTVRAWLHVPGCHATRPPVADRRRAPAAPSPTRQTAEPEETAPAILCSVARS